MFLFLCEMMEPNGGSSSVGAADGASDHAAGRKRHSKRPKCVFLFSLSLFFIIPIYICNSFLLFVHWVIISAICVFLSVGLGRGGI